MKIEAVQSPVISQYKRVEDAQSLEKVTRREEIKEKTDDVKISLKGYQRLRESEALSEDSNKTKMELIKNDKGIVFRFTDKNTGDIVKEIPSEGARAQSERISKYLDRITKDLKN